MIVDTQLERLARVLSEPGGPSAGFVQRILSAAQDYLGADVAFLAEFAEQKKWIRHAVGAAAETVLAPNTAFPLQETYCYRVVQGELKGIIPDTRQHPRVRDLPITDQLDIGAYVGVPVSLPDGKVFGTLCCVNHSPCDRFSALGAGVMEVLATLIGEQVYMEAAVQQAHHAKLERVEWVLEQGSLDVVFQPIVDLASGDVVAVEALSRFPQEPLRGPDLWFRDAKDVGLGQELELLAVRRALEVLPDLPDGVDLNLNVSPYVCVSDAFARCIAGAHADRLVIELTEHDIVECYGSLLSSLAKLRNTGIRVALDDMGTGYSGLLQLARVAPEIVKMDRTITADIGHDVMKQELMRASADLAQRMGFSFVAEGVETAEDAAMLRSLGVEKGQGYFFGKPGPIDAALRVLSYAVPT